MRFRMHMKMGNVTVLFTNYLFLPISYLSDSSLMHYVLHYTYTGTHRSYCTEFV